MVNTSDILPNTPRYLKVPLIFFNIILFILGIVLIALGAYSLKELQSVEELISIGIPAGIVVLGVFIVVLTVVGCAVAYKEKLVGLIFYTVVMLVLLVALIGVGGGAYTYRERVPDALEKAWIAEMPVKNVNGFLQESFKCCGWTRDDNGNTSYVADSKTCLIRPNITIDEPCMINTTVQEPTYLRQNCSICSPVDPTPVDPTPVDPTPVDPLPTPPSTNGTDNGTTPTPDPSTGNTTTPAPTPDPSSSASVRSINAATGDLTVCPNGPEGSTVLLGADYNCVRATEDQDLSSARFENVTKELNSTCKRETTRPEFNPEHIRGCSEVIPQYVSNRLYVAAVAGIVVGVIEFVCMLFSLFLIVRLCRSPRARSYD